MKLKPDTSLQYKVNVIDWIQIGEPFKASSPSQLSYCRLNVCVNVNTCKKITDIYNSWSLNFFLRMLHFRMKNWKKSGSGDKKKKPCGFMLRKLKSSFEIPDSKYEIQNMRFEIKNSRFNIYINKINYGSVYCILAKSNCSN